MCFDRVLFLSCSLICLPIFYSSLYNCKSLFKDLMKAFSSFLCSFFFFFVVVKMIISVSFSDTLYHTAYWRPSYRFLGSPVINYFEDEWGPSSHWVFTRSCSSPLASVFCFNRIGSSIMSFLSWSPLLPRSFCLCTLHPCPKKAIQIEHWIDKLFLICLVKAKSWLPISLSYTTFSMFFLNWHIIAFCPLFFFIFNFYFYAWL